MKSDEILITQIWSGDISVFNKLFHSIYIQLYIHCRKYINDPETAKDLLQNIFLRFWEKREDIDIHTSLNAYLHKSVKNECLNHLRTIKTFYIAEKEQAGLNEKFVDETTPDSELAVQEIEQIIENVIEQLPGQCKSIFKLSRINGLKNKEIADRLDISVRTVETQIYRALKILKIQLKDYLAS
ncbi:MAG: RNA polymerase sigma-70 factor [Tannerellaceae bacterium]|jgi:RNA polymerase sigma-70 factor (ECF subfamily)|nr:RNA polymerase sigma-70 factor [Tannerellaceae bacterium]